MKFAIFFINLNNTYKKKLTKRKESRCLISFFFSKYKQKLVQYLALCYLSQKTCDEHLI